jgi:hypothetical protein
MNPLKFILELFNLALRDLHIAILNDLDGINLALHISFYIDAVHFSFSMHVFHHSFSMDVFHLSAAILLHLASTLLLQTIAQQMGVLLYTKERWNENSYGVNKDQKLHANCTTPPCMRNCSPFTPK